MILQSHNPDPGYAHLVREYYFFATGPGNPTRFVPVIDDGCYDFIFFRERDSTLTYGPQQEALPIPYRVFTIHQLSPPYTIRFGSSLTFFTIKVQPWANAHFFSRLSRTGVLDLEPHYPDVARLHVALFREETLAGRFRQADAFIAGQNQELSEAACFVRELCEAVQEARGMISVNALSDRFGKSRQYLARVFRQEALYSLKRFVLTVRIMDLVKYRIKNPDLSMTELCYRYDYFDQPHFNRDFKQICGVTPTRFFENLPEFLLRH